MLCHDVCCGIAAYPPPSPLREQRPSSEQHEVLVLWSFGSSIFWSSVKIKFFLQFWGWEMVFGGLLMTVLPPTFTPSQPLEVEIGKSPDNLSSHGACEQRPWQSNSGCCFGQI